MKKYSKFKNNWFRVHTPFLKVILVIIGIWILVMLAVNSYFFARSIKLEADIFRQEMEARAFDTLRQTLDYFAVHPREMDESPAENMHFTMRQISDADLPQNTWYITGRYTNGDRTYRMEKCFAVPDKPDNQ